MGESITSGVISRWLVAEGTWVAVDQPLFELETDKITTEVASPAAGALSIASAAGSTVAIGAVVGVVDTSAAKPAGAAAPAAKAAAAPAAAATAGAAANAAPQAGPAASKLLAENPQIDASRLAGSGKDGRVTKGDVLAALATPAPAAPAPATPVAAAAAAPAATAAGDGTTRTRMTPIRARIAARLVQAQRTAAILTTFNEIDMSAVMALRSKHKEAFEKKHGTGLGFMSFFVKAAVAALQRYPLINARIDGEDIVRHQHVHMGIAVGTERGLVVPVLRHAERQSFAQIEQAIREYGKKAKEGRLAIADMEGGTFTITNGGVYGSLMSTPIINPPQSGILGMHAIKDRPMAINGQVLIRPMMYVALSYDHRIVDGAEAVGFLVAIKDAIEAPERLLLDL
jgi:2-oxoglutarate dehydrogenase E2 component (dihydrolipoamide succinyltransferase)